MLFKSKMAGVLACTAPSDEAILNCFEENGSGDAELIPVEGAGIMEGKREGKFRATAKLDERSKKQRVAASVSRIE